MNLRNSVTAAQVLFRPTSFSMYLDHRNIQHTVRYTAANPARFEKLWWWTATPDFWPRWMARPTD